MNATLRRLLYVLSMVLFLSPAMTHAKKKRKKACKKGFVAQTKCTKKKVCVPNLRRVKKFLKKIDCRKLGNSKITLPRELCTKYFGKIGARFCAKVAKNGKVNLKSTCRQLKALKGCSVKVSGCVKKKGTTACTKPRPFCADLNKCIWTRTKRICKTKCVKKKAGPKKKKVIKKKVSKKKKCEKPRLRCVQKRAGSCLKLDDKTCRRGYTYDEKTWKGGKGYTGCQTWSTHCQRKDVRIDCDAKGCKTKCTKPQRFCAHFRGIQYARRKKDCCSKVGSACLKWAVQCAK